jgi:photosystem II stability/assembly factor-like uncharacterized protein
MTCKFTKLIGRGPDTVEELTRLHAMSFSSSTCGWFATPFKLFRTTDGGWNWQEVPVGTRSPHRVCISAPTDLFCAVLMEGLEYCYTDDGGRSWRTTCVAPGRLDAAELVFTDDRHGWLLSRAQTPRGVPSVFRTTDGGVSWREYSFLAGQPYTCCFATAYEGWLIAKGELLREAAYSMVLEIDGVEQRIDVGGERNWICQTVDGGRTWKPISWIDRDLLALGIDRSDPNRLYCTGFGGFLAISVDRGKTWKEPNTHFEGDLYGPAIQGRTVVVPGVRGVVISTDTGHSWIPYMFEDAGFFAHMFDERSGVIGATRGVYRFEVV